MERMNPRTRRIVQKGLAVSLYLLVVLVLVLAFVPIQYPDWWPGVGVALPVVEIPWWPWVNGMSPDAHYSARLFLSLAFGLTIFLPQVETTFVSLLRQRSPIGAPYVDRKHFACPNCGTVNRPSVQFCVRCGIPISGGTRHWGPVAGQTQGGFVTLIRILLATGVLLAFFLGLFDLTIFSAIVGMFGTDSGVVLFATVLSTVPSLAGYVALKEGVFRRYGSLRRFDKLVFGNAIWVLFGLLFLILAVAALLGPPPEFLGSLLVIWVQAILGILMIVHPMLRRRVATSGTLAYP